MVSNICKYEKAAYPIQRNFFLQKTTIVARALLGCLLERSGLGCFVIVETEAYLQDDPASHSFRGPTKRNRHMFLLGGHTYVYLIYGLHYCFNIVTQQEGVGEAVLIRSVWDLSTRRLIRGPGNVCRQLQIDLSYSGLDLLSNRSLRLWKTSLKPSVKVTKRIGITKGVELKYRFLWSEL